MSRRLRLRWSVAGLAVGSFRYQARAWTPTDVPPAIERLLVFPIGVARNRNSLQAT
jgi:hypothetical protein